MYPTSSTLTKRRDCTYNLLSLIREPQSKPKFLRCAPPVLHWAHSPTKPKSGVESCCWWVSKEYLQKSKVHLFFLPTQYDNYMILLLLLLDEILHHLGPGRTLISDFWLPSTVTNNFQLSRFLPETEAVLAARILVDIPPVPRPLPASFVSTLRASACLFSWWQTLAKAQTRNMRWRWGPKCSVFRFVWFDRFFTWYVDHD